MAITYAAKFGDRHIISDGERCEINGLAVERWQWDAAIEHAERVLNVKAIDDVFNAHNLGERQFKNNENKE